jgi:hypothetical protein
MCTLEHVALLGLSFTDAHFQQLPLKNLKLVWRHLAETLIQEGFVYLHVDTLRGPAEPTIEQRRRGGDTRGVLVAALGDVGEHLQRHGGVSARHHLQRANRAAGSTAGVAALAFLEPTKTVGIWHFKPA